MLFLQGLFGRLHHGLRCVIGGLSNILTHSMLLVVFNVVIICFLDVACLIYGWLELDSNLSLLILSFRLQSLQIQSVVRIHKALALYTKIN